MTREALLFEAAGAAYLTPLDQLDEVLMPVELLPVAGAPDFLCGAMNLRGESVPVIALAERLGAGAPGPWRRASRILKVSVADHVYGVIVDAVRRIEALDEAVAQAPVLAEQAKWPFLGTMWRIDGDLIQEIRLDALLDEGALSRLRPRLALDSPGSGRQ